MLDYPIPKLELRVLPFLVSSHRLLSVPELSWYGSTGHGKMKEKVEHAEVYGYHRHDDYPSLYHRLYTKRIRRLQWTAVVQRRTDRDLGTEPLGGTVEIRIHRPQLLYGLSLEQSATA